MERGHGTSIERVGKLIDALNREPEGSHLIRVAERLKMGLPATRTALEMKAVTAEARARRLIADGGQPSLTAEQIAQLTPIVDAKYRRNRLGRAARPPQVS